MIFLELCATHRKPRLYWDARQMEMVVATMINKSLKLYKPLLQGSTSEMSCESRRGYVKVFFFENEKIQYLFLFSSPSFWLHTAGPIHTHLREVWMKFLKFLAFTMVLARQNWDKNALDDVKCSDKVEWQRVRRHEAVRHKLRNRQKMHFFVFLVCFWAYVGQPHGYIGWCPSHWLILLT